MEQLVQVYRSRGSGTDTYTLILAPTDWAESIAQQFVDKRGYGSQVIAYKPIAPVDSAPQIQEEDHVLDDEEAGEEGEMDLAAAARRLAAALNGEFREG